MKAKPLSFPASWPAFAARVRMDAGVRPDTRKARGRFEMKASGDAQEYFLFDEISPYWGVRSAVVVPAIKAAEANAAVARHKVYINSPGGSMIEAIAIFNALAECAKPVEVHVDFALSAASFIAMAGDEVSIASNGFIMIHEPSTDTWGTAKDLRTAADILEKIGGSAAKVYADFSGKTEDEVQALMDAETWYMGQEAVDAGFATSVVEIEGVPADADMRIQFDVRMLGGTKVPDEVKAKVKMVAPADPAPVDPAPAPADPAPADPAPAPADPAPADPAPEPAEDETGEFTITVDGKDRKISGSAEDIAAIIAAVKPKPAPAPEPKPEMSKRQRFFMQLGRIQGCVEMVQSMIGEGKTDREIEQAIDGFSIVRSEVVPSVTGSREAPTQPQPAMTGAQQAAAYADDYWKKRNA